MARGEFFPFSSPPPETRSAAATTTTARFRLVSCRHVSCRTCSDITSHYGIFCCSATTCRDRTLCHGTITTSASTVFKYPRFSIRNSVDSAPSTRTELVEQKMPRMQTENKLRELEEIQGLERCQQLAVLNALQCSLPSAPTSYAYQPSPYHESPQKRASEYQSPRTIFYKLLCRLY